jgi:glutamate N-acetyltransferase/amino-acid N-acetyltransferase
MPIAVPLGYRFAGVHCGVKRDPRKEDLTLVVSDRPAVAAGVYTQNKVFAACVAYDRARTPGDKFRTVVINSGNANACTGQQGLIDTAEMARLAAAAAGAKPDQALVMSTGVIGRFLPMDKISTGIHAAAARLAADEAALAGAARGILTTDTVPKLAGRRFDLAGKPVHITGIAKGAAMIGPNMATMLALILTDLPLAADIAQNMLAGAVENSFNCISVEGHMSTNDTVLLLANGAAGTPPLIGLQFEAFETQLGDVCEDLAKAIVADGEGATHLVQIDVIGCRTRGDARIIAQAIANSPLVKTAIHGGDPNWGRIVSAVGYSGVEFNPARIELEVNGHFLYHNGTPVAFDAKAASDAIRENRGTHIVLRLKEGDERIRFWTTDLTAEYVRLNADYHT